MLDTVSLTQRGWPFVHARQKPFYKDFEKVQKTVNTVSYFVYSKIFIPGVLGIAGGVASVAITIGISYTIEFLGMNFLDGGGDEEASTSIWSAVFLFAPMEEIIFRHDLQTAIKKKLEKALPTQDVKIFMRVVKVATMIAILVTASVFGLVHYTNGYGVIPIILCSIGGVIDGVLYEELGLTASVVSHMTHNALVGPAIGLIDFLLFKK